jgi:hypothetical protein
VATYGTIFGPEPFTTAMAWDAGLHPADLDALQLAGVIRRVIRGTYVDQSVPDALAIRARVLSLVVPSGSVVGLRTAAWFWGMSVMVMGTRGVPEVDLLRPAGSAASRRAGTMGHTGPLETDDVVERGGLRLTKPVRTAADIARLMPRPDALAMLDAWLALPYFDREALDAELVRFTGYRGVGQARELVAFADKRSESAMESRARLRAHDAGFPPFEPQVVVRRRDGRFVARLDLGRREECRGIEYDGDIAHGTAAQQQHDLARRQRVEQCGWGLAVVTGEQVNSRGLAFERGVAELLGVGWLLSRSHPSRGGWDGWGRFAVGRAA